jgi:peptidoglycan hydrolase FlgJ
MEITSLQRKVDASEIEPEQLAGNSQLSQREKIGEASRQFEAVLLRQILESTQKTVIKSKYADNSTSSAIYRDQVTSQLAQSISKSGAFGLAKVFEQQLNRPASPALNAVPISSAHINPPETGPRKTSGAAHSGVAVTRLNAVHSTFKTP